MSQDIWADAPADATHYDPIDKNFLRELDRVLLLHHNTQGWGYTHHSQYASKVENCRQPLILRPAWTGEGLPPAGTVCEYRRIHHHATWRAATILCVGEKRIFFCDYEGDELSRAQSEVEFRPIRTAEQIAADERKVGIQALLDMFNSNFEGHVLDGLSAIYDAGYRKEPTQ